MMRNQGFKQSLCFYFAFIFRIIWYNIAEAMFLMPIITTTKTPWSAIKNRNLGWFVNPEKEALKTALHQLFNSSEKKLSIIGNRAKSYISKKYDSMSTSKQMKQEIISSIQIKK